MEESKLSFRKAQNGDVNQIQILISSNLENTTIEYSKGFIQNPYDINELINTWVISNEVNNVIAVCIIRDLVKDDVDVYNIEYPNKDIQNGKYVYSVCVDEAYRGKNIANSLYDNLKIFYHDSDLYVDIQHEPHNNIASRKFHEKIGFKLKATCLYKGSTYGLYCLKLLNTINDINSLKATDV